MSSFVFCSFVYFCLFLFYAFRNIHGGDDLVKQMFLLFILPPFRVMSVWFTQPYVSYVVTDIWLFCTWHVQNECAIKYSWHLQIKWLFANVTNRNEIIPQNLLCYHSFFHIFCKKSELVSIMITLGYAHIPMTHKTPTFSPEVT